MSNNLGALPNLASWLTFGERGISSEAIASYLSYGSVRPGFNDPSDPADFRRCEVLLQWVPEFRAEFHRMAEVSPRWAALVRHWDAIKASLEAEIPDVWANRPRGSAPITYELMQNIENQENN